MNTIFSNLKDILLMFLMLLWIQGVPQMYLSLLLGFLFSPKFLKYRKLKHRKKNRLHHQRKIKMSRIMVFWSDCKTKTLQNVVLGLIRETKMPQNSRLFLPAAFHKLARDRVKGYINCCSLYSFVFLKYWQDLDDYWVTPNERFRNFKLTYTKKFCLGNS